MNRPNGQQCLAKAIIDQNSLWWFNTNHYGNRFYRPHCTCQNFPPPPTKIQGGMGKKLGREAQLDHTPRSYTNGQVTAHIHVSVSCRTKPGWNMDRTWTDTQTMSNFLSGTVHRTFSRQQEGLTFHLVLSCPPCSNLVLSAALIIQCTSLCFWCKCTLTAKCLDLVWSYIK